jgi:hypothetical protein
MRRIIVHAAMMINNNQPFTYHDCAGDLGSDKLTEWRNNRAILALTCGIAQLALLLMHHCFVLY